MMEWILQSVIGHLAQAHGVLIHALSKDIIAQGLRARAMYYTVHEQDAVI
jgi:hypothetical protein